MTAEIEQFTCRSDNFGVLLHDPETGATATIDAPDGAAVDAALQRRGWQLSDILVTHHHADHVEGIPFLKAKYPYVKVTAPEKDRSRISGADLYVREGDAIAVGSIQGEVIETPGHTMGHVVFWFERAALLFTGDTLFALGCGRVETPMNVMWSSLEKLKKLPPATQIYCGHEYTQSNASFAVTVDPDNIDLRDRAREIKAMRAARKMTLPTSIKLELATNPFFRVTEPALRTAAGLPNGEPNAVFGVIRKMKDRF